MNYAPRFLLIALLFFVAAGTVFFLRNFRMLPTPDARSRYDTAQESTSSDSPEHTKGLTIVQARYGAWFSWIDVTELLNSQIVNGVLDVHVGNNLAGDIAYGRRKRLEVEYVLDGVPGALTREEGTQLRLPENAQPLEKEISEATWASDLPDATRVTTKNDLVALVQRCPAQVGFYGVNLDTGKTTEYSPDQPACMASIVKLFVLLSVVDEVRSGRLDWGDRLPMGSESISITEAVDRMIGQSDNAATNALADKVGFDAVCALPGRLGMDGVSEAILPKPGLLEDVLNKRVVEFKRAPVVPFLPQHASAKGMVRFFELLHEGKLISPEHGADVLAALKRHPRSFVPHAPEGFGVFGKGGSLSWTLPPRPQYNMVGWNLYVRNGKTAVAFCLWGEWFPEKMPDKIKLEWLSAISDGILKVLLSSSENSVSVTDQQMM